MSSETRMKEMKERQADESSVMLADERRILFVDPEKYIYPPAFRYWPNLNLLDLGFIMQIRMVMVYGEGNKALIVTKNKKVYSLDYNKDDHFSTGKTLYPKQLKLPLQTNIKTVACSLHFVYVLFETGEVYFWRHRERKFEDLSSSSKTHYTPAWRVNGFANKYIADIACGGSHCLALTKDGEVYAWGKNDWGQIGNGNSSDTDICGPTQVELKGEKIVHIACGAHFNMVVTDTDKVYGWGNNKYGQILNIYNYYNLQPFYVSPQEVTTILAQNIKKVSCGVYHIMALTDEGKIFSWGRNNNGQIGIDIDEPICCYPKMVNMPESVKDIAAYGYLSVALSKNGIVYVWGNCFGQNIKFPLRTKFSRIEDAFAFSNFKVMFKPLIVSDSDVKGILNILKSLKDNVSRVEFGDPAVEVEDILPEVEMIEKSSFPELKAVEDALFNEVEEGDIEENKDAVQEERSKSSTNEIDVMLTDERRILLIDFEKYIYPRAFRNWPILNLLDLEFIMQIRMVMVYGDGNKALIVTKNKKVYTLDYNRYDYFSTGKTLYPKLLELPLQTNIKTVACSSHFVSVLFENGEVYFWKHIEYIFDDGSFSSKADFTPARVPGLNDKYIVDIACGTQHCLALTEDGQVYAWGKNYWGEIGNGTFSSSDTDVCEPTQVELKGEKIVHIVCGPNFNMVVTDTGKVYGWGHNKYRQIPIDGIYYKNVVPFYVFPKKITAVLPENIKKVSCGFGHILALTDEKKIYAWGRNNHGQIGTNSNLSICTCPMMVNMPELVKDIAAYGNLSVALSNNGIVYVWGDCFGQNIKVPLPTKLSGIQDAFAFSKLKVMFKPLIVSDSDVNGILSIFDFIEAYLPGMQFDDATTNDIIIKIGEDRIFVHEYILKTRSEYFKNKFDERDWIENNKRSKGLPVYNVPDKISYIVYKSYIQYLYTGKVDLLSSNVSELMTLAIKYNEKRLYQVCFEMIGYKQYSLCGT